LIQNTLPAIPSGCLACNIAEISACFSPSARIPARFHLRLPVRMQLGACLSIQPDRPQPERVLSFRDHRQRNGCSIQSSMYVPGLEPRAQPWIKNIRLACPEIRLETAFNLEMIQLQLDARNVFGKVAPDIVHAYMQSDNSASHALCLDDHAYLPFNAG